MRAITGSTRTIWIMAGVAVISLGAGLGLSQLIVSPAEEAANVAPPDAGPITVPVEQKALANDVIMRGDAIYEDPAPITIETGDIGGPAVVTGGVPEVGATLNAGSVILEVTGRPVILLPGELPVYRTLRAGVSGPDVAQLKAALRALSIDPGNDTNAYDASTAAAVRALYARVGYPAPSAGEEADTMLKDAQDGVRTAEEGVATAQRDLNTANGGASSVERLGADQKIGAAQRAVVDAQAELDKQTDIDGDGLVATALTIANLQDAVALAQAERDALLAPRDASAARSALTGAQRALTDARTALTAAQQAVITPLPASEVSYLTLATPRRVDTVAVQRGSLIAGTPVMTVSGATLQIAGNVANTDADLITEGAAVVITMPDGTEVPGTVQSIGAPEAGGTTAAGDKAAAVDPNRKRVVVVPGELTEDQRMQLQGANVRVEIPVSSTEGEVMAVPIAALTAGPGGESRVEVLDDSAKQPRLVTVETGLAAGGFVEVTPTDGALKVGDQVVVGTTAAAEKTGDEKTGDEDTSDTPTDEATDAATDESGAEG